MADTPKEAATKFVLLLMHARTTGHLLHLGTRSYAQHKALNEFYDEIGDLADDWAEAYQGIYGLLEGYASGYTPPSGEAVKVIETLLQTVRSLRKLVPQDSELQNIIDEICALFDSTLYKLRFLA